MGNIDLINNFFKFFFMNLFIFMIFLKLINYNKMKIQKNIFIILFSIVASMLFLKITQYISRTIFLLLYFPIYLIILSNITNKRLSYTVIPILIAIVLTYLNYIIAVILDGIITYILKLKHSSFFNIIIIFYIEFMIVYCVFKMKRLKNGLYFLENLDQIQNIGKTALLFYCIVIFIYTIINKSINYIIDSIMVLLIILIITVLFNWIKNEITKYYKKKMLNRTIELQKIELDEQLENINELKENNLKLSTVIHKYNNRLSALEKAVIKTLNNNMNKEFAVELTPMLENIKTMSKEFSKEVIDTTSKKKNLPKTNIQSIDNIFEYMQEEAIKENINFDLKINSSINYLIENIIDVKDFETLIGDHIRDAIIAITSEKVENKNIMCILGIVENCYEFSIYDTGIEFEIDTLLNLGLKHITTHSETGGTGIGFMTSFETLNKCKGSLIIEEYSKETNIYTKCVTFRFDSKGEYRIYSYRSDQIKSEMKDKNRIKVKQI